MAFSIHAIYQQIFKVWREKRLAWFEAVIQPQAHETLLDVGGYAWAWTRRPQRVKQIDTLNVHVVAFDPEKYPEHRIRSMHGDGCAMEFPDNAYDIVFSNSVLEHVGDWERQKAFAAEVRRVGRRLWIQTPAYECPFEPHFLAPFVHWLPVKCRKLVVRWLTPWGFMERPSKQQVQEMVDTTRLLRRREVAELFPGCQILVERLFGLLPKSYIVVRDDNSPPLNHG
jgi:hypothetical protein